MSQVQIDGRSPDSFVGGAYAWVPSSEVMEKSRLSAFMQYMSVGDYDELVAVADKSPDTFWDAVLKFTGIEFYEPYRTIVDKSRGEEFASWCVGGVTNIVLNCIDKHRSTATYERTFLISRAEDGSRAELSYREFDERVSRLAGALRNLGVRQGDVVALYMPMVPETFIAFFAVMKVGAIACPLFSGFGPQALTTRLQDAQACCLITVSAMTRRGARQSTAATLLETLKEALSVRNVILADAIGSQNAIGGVSTWGWGELLSSASADQETAHMPADAPCILLFTSGTTGRPKGVVYTHCGFVAKMALDIGVLTDFRSTDRFMFPSDMGWMVGPMAAVIPGVHGGSVVLMDGAPDYPGRDRFWRVVDEEKVTYLGVSPTLVRVMMAHGERLLAGLDFESLRIVMSAGEAFNEGPWYWFYEHVCRRKIPILNYSGGTEVGGGILTSTLHHPNRPGSFGGPIPGMGADIVDEDGASVGPGQSGELVLRNASIGLTRGFWNDPEGERYLSSYWRTIPGIWVHGDLAERHDDGLWYIRGRSDDILKIAGKRVGPTELESALVATGLVCEAAVVSLPDEKKGERIVCVCVPAVGVTRGAGTSVRLGDAVVAALGSSFRPSAILLVSELPKTRNMKIMRRVVRAAVMGTRPGDLSSLVNPRSLEEIKSAATA